MFDPLILHRVAHALYRWGVPKLPGLLARLNYGLTHCDLPPSVQVGRGVRFQHFGCGVVVHHKAEIGDDVLIMPHAVIGQRVGPTGVAPLEHIRIGRGAMLGAGCKIIAEGAFEIGEGASIGANAVVLAPVPAWAVAVGVPARVRPGPSRPGG